MAKTELAMVAWKEQFEPKNWKSQTEKCEANVRAEKPAGSSCTSGHIRERTAEAGKLQSGT